MCSSSSLKVFPTDGRELICGTAPQATWNPDRVPTATPVDEGGRSIGRHVARLRGGRAPRFETRRGRTTSPAMGKAAGAPASGDATVVVEEDGGGARDADRFDAVTVQVNR